MTDIHLWTGDVGTASDGSRSTWSDAVAAPEIVPGVVLMVDRTQELLEVVAVEPADLPDYAPSLRRLILRTWVPPARPWVSAP